MGMVHAYQKGELRNASAQVKQIAKGIKPQAAKEYASTKHDKLPEKVAMDVTRVDLSRTTLGRALGLTQLNPREKAAFYVPSVCAILAGTYVKVAQSTKNRVGDPS